MCVCMGHNVLPQRDMTMCGHTLTDKRNTYQIRLDQLHFRTKVNCNVFLLLSPSPTVHMYKKNDGIIDLVCEM